MNTKKYDYDAIGKDWDAGLPVSEIAVRNKVDCVASIYSVIAKLRKDGLVKNTNRSKNAGAKRRYDYDLIIKKYKDGETSRKIARDMKMSLTHLYRIKSTLIDEGKLERPGPNMLNILKFSAYVKAGYVWPTLEENLTEEEWEYLARRVTKVEGKTLCDVFVDLIRESIEKT